MGSNRQGVRRLESWASWRNAGVCKSSFFFWPVNGSKHHGTGISVETFTTAGR